MRCYAYQQPLERRKEYESFLFIPESLFANSFVCPFRIFIHLVVIINNLNSALMAAAATRHEGTKAP